MKNTVYLKSTWRKPVQMLLILLLTAFVSFALVSKLTEYVIVSRETERLSGFYRSIGSLTADDPAENDVTAARESIQSSEYVEFDDVRRVCVATLVDRYNANIDGSDSDHPGKDYTVGLHASDGIFYATADAVYPNADTGDFELRLAVDSVVCGYPEHIQAGDTLSVTARASDGYPLDGIADIATGERYLFRAYFDPTNAKSWEDVKRNLYLKPLCSQALFIPVTPQTMVDLDAPGMEELQNDVKLLLHNQRSVVAITTHDMSAMPLVQYASDFYYLTDGRWLTREDDLLQNRVCVIHKEFAALRGLDVGDTLTLTLHDKAPEFNGYLLDGTDYSAFAGRETETLEFTVVGTYGMLSSQRFQPMSRNLLLFIPDSCLPSTYPSDGSGGIYADDYSFVLKSSEYQNAFVNTYKDALAELGFSLSFVENSSANYWTSVQPLRQSAAAGVAVWSVLLLVVTALVAFLYLRQRRREFAILRALGMPSRKASSGMLVPIAVIGLVGICGGGVASWRYSLAQAAQTLSSIVLPDGEAATPTLSPIWLAGFCAAIFAILLLFVAAGVAITSRASVLELLCGNAAKVKMAKPKRGAEEARAEEAPATEPETPRSGVTVDMPHITAELSRAHKGNAGARARFVVRQVFRAPLKSILSAAVALLFMGALAWMNMTMIRNNEEIDRLYNTTVVTAEILQNSPSTVLSGSGGGVISPNMIDTVMNSGFVDSAYLVAAAELDELTVDATDGSDGQSGANSKLGRLPSQATTDSKTERFITVYGFDDAERFFAENPVTVVYADQWNESMFAQEWSMERFKSGGVVGVILSETMMERLGLQLGDAFTLSEVNGDYAFEGGPLVAGYYVGGIQAVESNEPILMPLSLLKTIQEVTQQPAYYCTARFAFDPTRNRELSGFRDDMQEAVKRSDAGLLTLDFIFWDDELTKVVEPMEKNLRLMEVLYPVMLAVSAAIAVGLSALMLLQNAKEAAIMRVLGATASKVRGVLCGMQMTLCVIGILLGAVAVAVIWKAGALSVWKQLSLFAILYTVGSLAGSLIAAFTVSAKKPLEMLQVKE